jgi:glycosyltransferase involved in cell wall biosynthesis
LNPPPEPAGPASAARRGISVILPVYNEEQILAGTADTVCAAYRSLGVPFELIIVDDGSRDRTVEIAGELAARYPGEVVVERHSRNMGIGAGLKTGFARARYQYITDCAADTPYTREHIQPFVAALGTADTLVGVRAHRIGYNPLMRFNSWLYHKLVRLLFRLPLRDVNWTCVYRADLLKKIDIEESGIPMLLEVLLKMRDLGGTFKEVEMDQPAREGGVASASRFRVMWRTGMGFIRVWRRWRKARKARKRGGPDSKQ